MRYILIIKSLGYGDRNIAHRSESSQRMPRAKCARKQLFIIEILCNARVSSVD
jgi:hypothetical protein